MLPALPSIAARTTVARQATSRSCRAADGRTASASRSRTSCTCTARHGGCTRPPTTTSGSVGSRRAGLRMATPLLRRGDARGDGPGPGARGELRRDARPDPCRLRTRLDRGAPAGRAGRRLAERRRPATCPTGSRSWWPAIAATRTWRSRSRRPARRGCRSSSWAQAPRRSTTPTSACTASAGSRMPSCAGSTAMPPSSWAPAARTSASRCWRRRSRGHRPPPMRRAATSRPCVPGVNGFLAASETPADLADAMRRARELDADGCREWARGFSRDVARRAPR